MSDIDALRRRARELAVEPSYVDAAGTRQEASPEALRRVVELVEADYAGSQGRRTHPVLVGSPRRVYAPGCDAAELVLADGTRRELGVDDDDVVIGEPLPVGSHRLCLAGPGYEETATIVVAPERMTRSPALAGGTALFAPGYALWERDAPLPSFRHLATLCERLPGLGVDALVSLPLYAAFLDEPFDPSPYAPVSRLHWNEVYLDDGVVGALMRDAGLEPPPVPVMGELVDWRVLARRRRRQLLDLAAALDRLPGVAASVHRWASEQPDVAAYARFRSTVTREPTDAGMPDAVVDASHRLAQWLAHQQLEAVESAGSAAFALDLPIGSHPAGFETWSQPDLWAPGMAVGAPPDPLFQDGQNWGFPPQLPGEAERTGFALWRELVAKCGRYASMLRIDHFLGVHRLWWVPEGMSARDGVYVRYPRHALVSVIAAEAAITRTTVVGEDLGTVPQEILDTLQEWDMLGLYAEQLVLSEPLEPVPARTIAGLRTHDMPAFASAYAEQGMEPYRRELERQLGRPLGTSARDILAAALTRLAASDAFLVVADIDDLLGETRPHNVPGQVLPSTWRRRLARPTSETLADPGVRQLLDLVTSRRPR